VNPSRLRLFTFAAPSRFYKLMGWAIPVCWILCFGFAIAGLYIGFFIAPTDATQGDAYRIIFIHVPTAWMSMLPTGAMFTFLALWTGAIWGKPTWGTWWVWDARLTTELILLFLYLGYIALVNAIDDVRRADQAGALLALVGSINVPIIYFSVKWWNTLHQGASVSVTKGSSMATTMLLAMLLMSIACWAYSFAVVFMRARAMTVERESHTSWVAEMTQGRIAR
jgi:heme exporter protein C